MSSSPVLPKSDHDWTIHSLNIHGVFFERWCQHVINSQSQWRVTTTNYPVQVEGHQSSLDIRADWHVGERQLILLIECKKNNPDFVDWVFFLKSGGAVSDILVPHIETDSALGPIRTNLQRIDHHQPTMKFVNDARETRGNYQTYKGPPTNRTKTSNAAITDAAMQIALATQSVYAEEVLRAQDRAQNRFSQSPPPSPLHANTNIVPVIVTTARLWICEFGPNDVDGSTGEIPFDKTTLSFVPRVLYEFPLPHHLHTNHPNEPELGMRRHIIIVHSSKLADFLANHTLHLLPMKRK